MYFFDQKIFVEFFFFESIERDIMYILGKELIVFNREIMEMENEYLV